MTEQPLQSRIEEWFNALSHLLTSGLAIAGFVMLIIHGAQSQKDWTLFSGIIYGLSLIILFGVSGIYHAVSKNSLKEKLRVLDHMSIFILIAGTYTPVALVCIGGTIGWIIFGVQWGMALLGILLKVFFTGKYEVISLIMYAVMGWMALVKIGYLYDTLPRPGFWLLLSGGFAYTGGIVFYVLDQKVKFAHFIWHLFVITGALLHYLLIEWYIIN